MADSQAFPSSIDSPGVVCTYGRPDIGEANRHISQRREARWLCKVDLPAIDAFDGNGVVRPAEVDVAFEQEPCVGKIWGQGVFKVMAFLSETPRISPHPLVG